MDLNVYFENTSGKGFLATADAEGRVDVAVYARPHVIPEDGTVAFIMADRLTRHNLESNPRAAYLFVEDGPGYKGCRLYLRKIGEEQDSERLHALRRRPSPAADAGNVRFLVFFEVEKTLPLVGAGDKGGDADA